MLHHLPLLSTIRAGGGHSTRAPDYSQWTAVDFLGAFAIIGVILGLLIFIMSNIDKRRRP
jgi:hypothetical protein